jgi:hypothetical protein
VKALAASVMLAALVSLPASAQQHGQGGRTAGPARPSSPQRDANHDARMTPEQRRQLRRDVADHGRDIYGRPNPNPNQR